VVHPEATRQAGAEDGLSERQDPGNGSLILGAEKRDPTAAAACMHARLESGQSLLCVAEFSPAEYDSV
jgi:hypothetical protein